MGLDAAVYKARERLVADPEALGLKLDEATGEWYSDTGPLPEPLQLDGVIAAEKRLGNVALVAALASEAQRLLPDDSVLLSRVLYDVHAGDTLSQEEVEHLKQEIATLGARQVSAEFRSLLADLGELIKASEENRNPIVFI